MTASYDVIVIGSGAAGLTAALALAQTRRVLVLAKGSLTGGSTAWAQGGIAAVLDAGDTFEDHIRDTMIAGAGLNRLETVEYVVERAPHAIRRLVDLGVPFFPLIDIHFPSYADDEVPPELAAIPVTKPGSRK